MFEHLGPVPETTIKKRLFSRGYMVFLLLALMVYTVADSSVSGPDVKASYQETGTRAFVYGATKQNDSMVHYSHGTVFDFFIEVASPGTSLSKLRLKINGNYDHKILSKIRLYNEVVQLGSEASIEGDYLYFDLGNYDLAQAKNHFYLVLSEGGLADIGDKFYFSIEDRADVFLSYKGHSFTASGAYPISSQQVSIVENGRLFFIDKTNKDSFYYLPDQGQELVNFALNSEIERAYLYKLVLNYKSDNDVFLGDAIFRLEQNASLIAMASVDSDKQEIIFDLDKFVAIKNNQPQDFTISVDSLPEAMYDFSIDIMAKGYFSGKDVGVKNIDLSKTIVREAYPLIQQIPLDEDIKEGWNKLYAISIKSIGNGDIDFDKLSWKINSANVDIKDIRLTLNRKVQDVGLNLNNEELSVVWEPNLKLTKKAQVLELLVNLENVNEVSSIDSYLLPDTLNSGNIIWSHRDVEQNAYLLPDLPLAPHILR